MGRLIHIGQSSLGEYALCSLAEYALCILGEYGLCSLAEYSLYILERVPTDGEDVAHIVKVVMQIE